MRLLKTILTLAFSVCLAASAPAHELEADRLTLVLRQPQHLSLRFHLDALALLHRALAPQQNAAEFTLQLSALPPAEFQTLWRRAQARVEQGVLLSSKADQAKPWQPATQWQWPAATQVQALAQQRTMQAVVAPQEHAHTESLEVQAEWLSPAPVGTLQLKLPSELARLLVVHYQPQQRWLAGGAAPATFRF